VLTRTRQLRAPLAGPFRWLWASQVVSQLGDWAARLALAVLVLDRTGSPALTTATLAVTLLPWVGLGQVLAAWVERFSRRRVLVVCDLARAAVFVLIGTVHLPVAVVLVLAFVAGAFDPPFEATRSAAIRELVPEDEYGDALSLGAITNQVALLAGYVLGGGLVAWLDPQVALVVNASTFALSAVFLLRLPPMGVGDDAARAAPLGTQLTRVRDALGADRLLRLAVFSYIPVAAAAMAVESLAPVYVRQVVAGTSGEIGLALAAVPLGTIAAAFVVRSTGGAGHLVGQMGRLAIAGSLVALAVFVVEPDLPLALLGFGAVGVVFTSSVPANTLAGLRIPADRRAGVFSVLQGLVLGSQALGAVLGGLVASRWDVTPTIILACALAGVLGAGILRRARRLEVVPLPSHG
jgi:MFS family permease